MTNDYGKTCATTFLHETALFLAKKHGYFLGLRYEILSGFRYAVGCILDTRQKTFRCGLDTITIDTYVHSGVGTQEQMALSMFERLGELLP